MNYKGKEISVLLGLQTRGLIPYKSVEFLLSVKDKCFIVFGACHRDDLTTYISLFDIAINCLPDYFILLQDDIFPPKDLIERFVESDKDVVTAPVWHFDYGRGEFHLGAHKGEFDTPENNKRFRIHRAGKGLERIDYAGMSCVCYKKKVLQAFKDRNEKPFERTKELKNFKGKEFDNMLYEKIRLMGFELWINWDIKPIIHHRLVDVSTEVLERFVKDVEAERENDKIIREL